MHRNGLAGDGFERPVTDLHKHLSAGELAIKHLVDELASAYIDRDESGMAGCKRKLQKSEQRAGRGADVYQHEHVWRGWKLN